MNIFELSHRGLARNYANSPKVGALFFIDAAAWLVMDMLDVGDFSSPWIIVTLVPVALIYLAERLGKIRWFKGMTLPSLFVMTGSVAFLWVLNVRPQVSSSLIYFVLASWIAAFCFLLVRIWTFDSSKQPTS